MESLFIITIKETFYLTRLISQNVNAGSKALAANVLNTAFQCSFTELLTCFMEPTLRITDLNYFLLVR